MSTEFITPDSPTDHPMDTDQEYVDKMVAKADAGLGNSPVEPEKLLAGKYKSEEELTKGILELAKKKTNGNLEDFYKSLEKDFHNPDGTIKVDKDEPVEPKEDVKEDDAEDDKTPQGAVLDFESYTKEFATNGTLSETTVEQIVSTGIPKEIVEQYVEGLKAVTENARLHAFNLVGGEAAYTDMVKWAKSTLKPEQIEAYNKAISTNDLEKRGVAIANLYKMYEEQNPQFIEADGGNVKGDGYSSKAEMVSDMRDPRYKKDPAFRAKVEQKIAKGRIF